MLSVVAVSAAWYIFTLYTSTATYNITSDNPNITVLHLLGGNIDTSDTAGNFTDTVTFNSNVAGSAYVYLNTIKTDIAIDACTNYENDCNVTYSFEGSPITNGTEINLIKGTNDIVVDVECVKWSCPQEIEAQVGVKLTEQT